MPDTSSEFADEGTAAHFLRDQCLSAGVDAIEFLGMFITVIQDGPTDIWQSVTAVAEGVRVFEVDRDMAFHVQKSIDVLRELAKGGTLYPEQKLPIGFITGEDGATGTADAVIIKGNTLIVDDLKYGMGVPVDAVENEQQLIYAAAAAEELDVLGEIEHIVIRISQPRINNDSEWTITKAELDDRIKSIRATADFIMEGPEGFKGMPGDKQCRFCKVKGSCEEYRGFVLTTVADSFVDLTKGEVAVSVIEAEKVLAQAYGVKPKDITFEHDAATFIVNKPSIKPQLDAAEERITNSDDSHLATCMDALDMVESWCKAVRAETERRLLLGQFTDSRYKLVEGKKGARSWIDADEAEKAMKAMRLKVDEMYDMKVISPTSAEKVLAAKSPRKWKKLQDQITQTQGKPSVAPASDKRPALSMKVEFEAVVEDAAEDLI